MKLKYRVIERFRGKYSVEAMCKVFEVSRSGYYAWRNRQGKENKDQWLIPNRFWATDITYIQTTHGMVYMCAVIDLCGKMVLAYRIGTNMTASLVTDTIRDAKQKEMVTNGLTLHSDQGSQYTSEAYFDLMQEYHIQPSMSSPGCPYDNAAMENFFGTLKTECLYRMKFSCRAQVEQAVAEYVQFYNFERINLKDGLTPFEIWSKTA